MYKMKLKQRGSSQGVQTRYDKLYASKMSIKNFDPSYPLVVFICEVKRGFPIVVWLMLVLQAHRTFTAAPCRHIVFLAEGLEGTTHHIEDVMAVCGE